MKRYLLVVLCWLVTTAPGLAQQSEQGPLPERRIEYQRDIDFAGHDIRSIFETDLGYCANACREDEDCQAFTFNLRAGACFLKSDVTETPAFKGALSGTLEETPSELLDNARQQREVAFIRDDEWQRAGRLYRHLERHVRLSSRPDLRQAILGNDVDAWLSLQHFAADGGSSRPDFLRSWAYDEMAFLANAWVRAVNSEDKVTALEAITTELEKSPERGPAILAAHRLLAKFSGDEQRLHQAQITYGPRVLESQAEADSVSPRFCAEYSEPLREDGFLYGDYVRVKGVTVDVTAEGQRLCIAGLEHGRDYHITLRKGLPAASGERTARTETFDILMPDRPPSVRFSGRGYVLPFSQAKSIPITAVNVDKVELRIFHLPQRGRPALLTASSTDGTDFNFVNLREAGFDLSDRGVAGTPAPDTVNLFATTERGIYRPGDSVYITALMRDLESRAMEKLPLTVIVQRPDGKEASRHTLEDQGAGGRVLSLPLPTDAMRGLWKLRFHVDPQADMLGEVGFLVEDFVPERIDFTLKSDEALVASKVPPRVAVAAHYLYGAVGANLPISGTVVRRPATGLAQYPGFHFGMPATEDQATSAVLPGGLTTDEAGKAMVSLPLPPSASVGQPEELALAMRLREGSGRPVERRLTLPMALESPVIGLKPLFERMAAENSDAHFDVIALDNDRQRMKLGPVEWTLSRIEHDYQWYRVNGEWGYSPVERRTRAATGSLEVAADAKTTLSAPVTWGEYELELRTTGDDAPVLTRHTFWAGYYGGAGTPDTPERLDTGVDQANYRHGDEVKLRFDARTPGIAFVRVFNGQLVERRRFEVVQGTNELALKVSKKWGTGAYLVTSLVTPSSESDGRNPRRAIGVNWVSVDTAQRTLDLSLQPQAPLRPRQNGTLRLSVDSAPAGETIYATVAMVDLGILNLTGYKAPQPEQHFFGQRRFAFDMRDLYGRLIDDIPGALATLREGGDSNAPAQAPGPKREEYVTLFSGLVTLDDNGEADIDLPLPAFNGTVRAMAQAWSQSALGSHSEDLIVRDPIVATGHAPSFLAPGDNTRLRLELAHAEGPVGKVGVEIATKGPVALAGTNTAEVELDEQERTTLEFDIQASESGTDSGQQGELGIQVTTPAGQQLAQQLPIAVKRNDLPIQRRHVGQLGKGDVLQLPDSLTSGMAADATLSISFGPLAHFNLAGLAHALETEPRSCTEQIVSSIEPLLSARRWLSSESQELADDRLAQGVERVLSRQAASGAFGLWAPGSQDFWLDAYTTEFLLRVREAGADVPERVLSSALRNLQNKVNGASGSRESLSAAAYALYVLSQAGEVRASDVRYFADAYSRADVARGHGGLDAAYLGAALHAVGDPQRANQLFRAAFDELSLGHDYHAYSRSGDIYASRGRDLMIAHRLALASGFDVDDVAGVDMDSVDTAMSSAGDGNTQERASALRLAATLLEGEATPAYTEQMSLAQYLASPPHNPLDKVTPVAVTLNGVPTGKVERQSSGVEISRHYYSFEGEPVDVADVTLNDKLVVVLKVTPLGMSQGQLAIEDPLPAGFQIDNPSVLASGDTRALEWFPGGMDPTYAEFGSERFFAAVTLDERKPFQLAYVVRAIQPGSFHHPAAHVQDMYVPRFHANTADGRVVISGSHSERSEGTGTGNVGTEGEGAGTAEDGPEDGPEDSTEGAEGDR
ncbi:alpha-2-macroglobulin family protein [Halomonas binhaiensis]|uniref:Alpha-2-macroglobulin n=1 Tax=Halomonas binhaiensis TaxID=2562282 RepID=A0A5C1NG41_9GAMM|nr:MG2 domain-containing protein [Halomonas binhaiensis]QEM82134.1 alpha-2-macroglobulin family protein [Halomonas binhaiensis]